MIKHYVMFKLKDFAEGATKSENALIINNLLATLPAKIPQIKSYEVHLNEKDSDRSADLLLISGFESSNSFDEYFHHREHLKVSAFIKLVSEELITVDFTG